MSLDRTKVGEIIDQVKLILGPLGKAHGLKLEMGRTTFNPTTIKFSARYEAEAEDGIPGEPASYRADAARLGISPDSFGLEVKYAGGWWRVIGLSVRARKYPIRMQQVGGRREIRKFTVDLFNQIMLER